MDTALLTETGAQDILDSIEFPVFSLSKEFNYTAWNQASEKLTGIAKEDALGKSLFELFPDIKGTDTLAAYEKVMYSKKSQKVESQYILKGTEHWFELSISPFNDGITVVTKNITNTRTLQKDLEEANDIIEETKRIAAIGLWRVDLVGDRTFWDDIVYSIHELPIGTKVKLDEAINFYRPDFRKMVEKHVESGILNKQKWDFEAILRTATGKEKWVRAVGYPVIENEEVIELRGLFMDIDQQKRQEQEKLMAKEQFETLFQNIGDFVCLHEPCGKYLKISPSVQEIAGYEPQELLGKNPFDLFHPEDREAVREFGLSPILNGERKKTWVEYRYRHKQGHYIWLSSATEAIYDEHNEVSQLVTSSRDISKRKEEQAEILSINDKLESSVVQGNEELNKLTLELKQQFEALDVSSIVSITDKAGKIIHVNQKFIDISGYSKEELIGQNHRILKSGKQPDHIFADMWNSISKGNVWAGEICNRTKNGKFYWVNTTIYPFRDAHGKITRFVSVRFDITEMKNQAEEVKQKTIELEKAKASLSRNLVKEKELNDLKSRFVATASHQFRTPLTVIQANMGLLSIYKDSMNQELQQRFDRVYSKIISQIGRMTDLMDEVLTLSKVNSGSIKVDKRPTNIIGICEKLTSNYNEIANWERVLLTVSGKLIMINLDPNLFEHAVSNFISNAIKYSPSAETILVKIEFRNQKVRITIEDKGIGVPQKELNRFFDPFFRGTNVEDIEGTGLGTSIAKEYIELNGGKVTAKSAVGKGTTIAINLNL